MISIRFEAADLAGIRLALEAFLDASDAVVRIDTTVRTEAARQGDAPELPKRTRRTKAEMEAARATVDADPTRLGGATSAPANDSSAAPTSRRSSGILIAAAATAEATPAPAAGAPPPPPSTFADAKAALTRVVETNGLGVEAATGLLKKFDVARLSQLEEGQWTGFVLACETAVKGAAA